MSNKIKLAVAFLTLALTANGALAQTNAPTLRIVTEDPNLPSELFYGGIKIKPIRLRPGTNTRITVEDNDFFVQQQYIDFLNRMPDSGGFNDWLNVLNRCTNQGKLGADPACDRVHVSSGFFRSTEFGERGYWVYRLYDGVIGRLPRYAEFVPDMRRVSGNLTPEQLEANRTALINDIMQRSEFTTKYAGLTTAANAAAFVEKLEQTAGVRLPETPSVPGHLSRTELISRMQSGTNSAAKTLQLFIETKEVFDKFFYRGFVAMQYFGYLRRDPEQAGYDDWVDVLTNGRASAGIAPGNYRHLIFGFIYATEYRDRF